MNYNLIKFSSSFSAGPTDTQWPYGLKNHSLYYWRAPRGPRVVKKSDFYFFSNKTVELLR